MSSSETLEIEKKFRLADAPPAERLGEGKSIDQAYLLVGDAELRIRRKAGTHTMTVKSSGDLVRREWEDEIPSWVFESLWKQAVGTLRKTRYAVSLGDLLLEIDEYHDELEGLWTLECELPSEEAAASFAVPEWVGVADDVTSDKRFKNKRLATEGLGLVERVSPR